MAAGPSDPTRRGVVAGAAAAPLAAGPALSQDLISIRTDLETWVAMGDKATVLASSP